MVDPYRMILVNGIASLLLFTAVVFYKFVYPRKNISVFILLILITILPIISILRIGVYESGDFTIHIYRTMDFYSALSQGAIMPSWAGNLNATYGYPLFIFNYSLPYYIISFFHFIGFGFIASMKLFLGTTFILSGVFMYLFAKKLYSNTLAAFTASIFYVFAPYHLIATHFKVTVGEVLTFTLIPLAFLLTIILCKKPSFFTALCTGVIISLLLMSHVIIGLFFLLLLLPYTYFLLKNKKSYNALFHIGVSLVTAFILSLPTWLGPLFLTPYSFTSIVPLGTAYFPPIKELLYSPWRGGLLFQGPQGEISTLVGYTHLFVLFTTIFFLITKKYLSKITREQIFWIIASVIVIFLITPYSTLFWTNVPFLKIVGSHRLLILLSLTTSIIAGYFVVLFRKKPMLAYVLIFLTISTTALNWGHRKVLPSITDATLSQNMWKSTSDGEGHFYANSRWADINQPWFSKLPKAHMEIIHGIGNVKTITRTSTKHTYLVHAETPLIIRENTLYFPGWQVMSNKKQIAIYPDTKGIIEFSLKKGISEIEVYYTDVQIYKTLKTISIGSILTILGFIAYHALFILRKRLFNEKK